jgi:DNA polymerase-3 subunit epsilon
MPWFPDFFSRGRAQRKLLLTPEQRQAIAAWQKLPAADMTSSHTNIRYVIVDVETSGLNMKKDWLISIGAVALVDGKMDFNDAFQVVLRQDQVSAHENILIHGIGGSAQSEGMEPAEALLAFLRYIGKAPLVAYHAFFDQSMIDKAMRSYLGMEVGQTWIDLAWVLPDFFKYRADARVPLDDWLRLFNIENILRHNAVSDAYATAKLLQVAIAHGVHKGADSPASFIKIEKARRWMYESR